MELSDVADLEPVIEVSLQRLIPLSEYNKHRSNAVEGDNSCLKNVPYLKMGRLLAPHAQLENLSLVPSRNLQLVSVSRPIPISRY